MGMLDSIFSKKKKDSATQKVMVEPKINDYQKAVVSADSKEKILKHADTVIPVAVVGSDFNGKIVIVASKASKDPNHTFNGKSYPVVIVDRLTIGIYEQVTFIGDTPQEEIDSITVH